MKIYWRQIAHKIKIQLNWLNLNIPRLITFNF